MAPQSSRRPGFSRRAQFGLFAGYVAAIVGALVGLLLVLTARFDPEGHAALQNLIADITAPVSEAGRRAIQLTGSAGSEVAAYFRAGSRNKQMSEELAEARRELVRARADRREIARLKRLARLVETSTARIVTARLVSSTGSSSRRYAILAAGSSDGVRAGMPVLSPEGLVGRVTQTGRWSSRVLMITDTGMTIPVKRLGDDVPAFAVGLGNGLVELRGIATADNPFKPGDIMVTSGAGGIYRPGIAVLRAIRKERDRTLARPTADPARLDFAIVEEPFVRPLPEEPRLTQDGK